MTIQSDDASGGTSVERTVLSWNRAAIAVSANGALLMRAGFVHDVVALQVFGLAIAFVGFAVWALSFSRYSAVARQPASHLFGGAAGGVPRLATFVLLLSVLDLAVVVFGR